MTYNEFVTQPYSIWRRILHKRDEISKLESICMKSTSEITERVQSSVDNTTERNYIALSDAKSEMSDLIESYQSAKLEVRAFLYDYLDLDGADLLEWKYVDGKSMREISDILGVEEQTARNKASRYDRQAREIFSIEYKKV